VAVRSIAAGFTCFLNLSLKSGGGIMKGFKISLLLIAILIAFTIILTGCGGGGGGGGGKGPSGATISGVASKGPISGGAVKVYALNADGSKGSQIGTTTTTKADGSYSVNIGSYTGASCKSLKKGPSVILSLSKNYGKSKS